jgi:hypothetical protein
MTTAAESALPGTPISFKPVSTKRPLTLRISSRAGRFPGAELRLIDGEVEILPGLRVVPTPGTRPATNHL